MVLFRIAFSFSSCCMRKSLSSTLPGIPRAMRMSRHFPEFTKNRERLQGIERSGDGGASWTKVSELTRSRVAVLFKNAVYRVGAEGLIVGTDKGKTWKTQGSAVDAEMGPFFGKDENHAVVVGKKGFFETIAGGKTWKQAAPLPFPGCRVDWFGNYAWDPMGNVFYFATTAQPALRYVC